MIKNKNIIKNKFKNKNKNKNINKILEKEKDILKKLKKNDITILNSIFTYTKIY